MEHEGIERRPVLFAYDGSDQAKASISEAARQLGTGRQAIVLCAWEPLGSFTSGGAPTVPSQFEEDFESKACDVAREGAALARRLGFEATAVTERGEPIWRAIVDAADAHDADLLVLGSHGRTGIARVLMGSVATAVSSHTERPVMIVHRALSAGPEPVASRNASAPYSPDRR